EALKDVDPIEFALEIFKNDRMGTIISPMYLTTFIRGKMRKNIPQKVLITEAEKHLAGLKALITEFPHSEFTLTTQFKPMSLLLKLGFSEYHKVKIVFESIYTDFLQDEKFDYIYSLPAFGYKPNELGKKFFTRDSDGIAMENMLVHLQHNGTLDIILPAKITFAGMGFEKLRAHIAEHYSVKSIYTLPEKTFRPATAVKTYLFTITTTPQLDIKVGTLQINKDLLKEANEKQISMQKFLSYEDWRIEMLFSDDDENIQRFKRSKVEKLKLQEVAEVFRGKSILKKTATLGNISILNISNIETSDINYSDMDTIEEEERKIKRYELLDGDVVLSCRGTAIKSAVFKKQDKIIIASANVIVIRPKDRALGEYIKIFLESPIGTAMIKSFQRGTTIMNINHSDIMKMELPILPISEQQEIINRYNEELSIYKAAMSEAESRWNNTKSSLYSKLV
ncbi:MAG: restriction endonuclease subunit S, partial [Sporomusaceae bacterium]|nr:restriction endonuclease subunit S [Sporomusaceae bacterium]